MTFFMRALSTALLLVMLGFPFFSIAQTMIQNGATTTKTAQDTASNGNSNALLYSGLGLAGILGGAYLLNLFGGGAAVVAKSAIKVVPFPFSFGGHVVQVIPCLNGALWVLIRSVRGPIPTLEAYIWTPLTITHLMGPPKIINEGVLGIADAPFICFTPVLVPLLGFRMTIVGTSGLPQL